MRTKCYICVCTTVELSQCCLTVKKEREKKSCVPGNIAFRYREKKFSQILYFLVFFSKTYWKCNETNKQQKKRLQLQNVASFLSMAKINCNIRMQTRKLCMEACFKSAEEDDEEEEHT